MDPNRLTAIPIFSHLSSDEAKRLAAFATETSAAEGQSQQELADSLLVTKGNVCQLLGRMEADGLIRRDQEGRVNRVFLTDKGREPYPVIVTLRQWGDRWLQEGPPPVGVTHNECG